MRGTVIVEVVVSATLVIVVAAQETTSLFLPYFAPGHPLLASIVDTDHNATTYSVACSIYEPTVPNGCRVPIPFYLTSGPTFMHATMSLPSTSEIRTYTTTHHSIPPASEYLYLFPAYTEDAYCHLLPTSASCLVTATGGALTVPTFTNRMTLVGEGFWGGWRDAVVTDVMPRSYGTGAGGEGGERVWRKSVVIEIPQTRDVVGEKSDVGRTPARTVGGVVPKETGVGAVRGGGMTMSTTTMPGSETATSAPVAAAVADNANAEVGDGDESLGADADTHTTTKIEIQEMTETKIIAETTVVTETLTVTELAISTHTERRGITREDL
ncbi:hypothetical protein VE02_04241 [Pseudogymnoascus sp. 03VT05]|nr:hypothetical protein VE02_04241 [Pseudogymnoascus sp. 03VT05]